MAKKSMGQGIVYRRAKFQLFGTNRCQYASWRKKEALMEPCQHQL